MKYARGMSDTGAERVRGRRAPDWTESEKQVIRNNHETKTDAEMSAMLPSRTRGAVATKRAELGIIRRDQTDHAAMNAKIREMWGKVRTPEIARLIGRDPSFVGKLALRMGLPRNSAPKLVTYSANHTPVTSMPQGFLQEQLRWARIYQGRDKQADLILLMHDEGLLMVAK